MPNDPDYPYYQDPNAQRDRREDEGEGAQEGDEDFEFDPLGPDEHDAHLLDDEAREDEVYCPACGELTYDDAPQCANCGHWITEEEDAGTSRFARMVTIIVVAAIAIALLLFMAPI